MRKTVYQPQGPLGYSRAVVVEKPTHDHVSMAGVIATDEKGNVVGKDDMGAQTRRVYENIRSHLGDLGGGLEDVVRHRVFVTTMDEEAIDAFHEAHSEFFEEPREFPAGTLVEIESLALPEAMIEIEVEAIVPDDGWETTVAEGDRS